MKSSQRSYQPVCARLDAASAAREQRMHSMVDALWDAFGGDFSWVGFYIDLPDQPDDRRLILGPCRDKAACSPIGLHGVCGRALLSREVQIVRDVNDLGESYIACDPRDRSEIVIPLFDEQGECWGVLDIDSWNIGAFSEHDARELSTLLERIGLTVTQPSLHESGQSG